LRAAASLLVRMPRYFRGAPQGSPNTRLKIVSTCLR
jgi:hypothetical protein